MKNNLILSVTLSLIVIVTLCSCNDKSTDKSESSADNSPVVYITETGTKYHKKTCSYLSKSKIETTLEKAKDQGYTRCSRCKPPNE